MENNTLTHHGIKGMKWGIRRFQNKDGSLTPAGKKRQRGEDSTDKESDAKTTSSKATKKSIKEMSSDELKERIARLELEKKVKDLNKDVNSSRGKDFALRVLEKIGENTLTNLGTQVANKALGEAINKAFGVKSDDTIKRIVNPNKGQSDKK